MLGVQKENPQRPLPQSAADTHTCLVLLGRLAWGSSSTPALIFQPLCMILPEDRASLQFSGREVGGGRDPASHPLLSNKTGGM